MSTINIIVMVIVAVENVAHHHGESIEKLCIVWKFKVFLFFSFIVLDSSTNAFTVRRASPRRDRDRDL
jgi:hypothetical protein